MNNKYSGKINIDAILGFMDKDDKRFVISAYDGRIDVGTTNNLDKAIALAKAYFNEELKSNPDLFYNYDEKDIHCTNFINIFDVVTDKEYNISIEDLAKHIIIKKIVGNIGKIG